MAGVDGPAVLQCFGNGTNCESAGYTKRWATTAEERTTTGPAGF